MVKIKNKLLLVGTLFLLASCIGGTSSSSSQNSHLTDENTSSDSSSEFFNSTNSDNSSSSSNESSPDSSQQESSSTQGVSSQSSSTQSLSSQGSSTQSSSSNFSTSYDKSDYEGYYNSINLNSTGDNLVKTLSSLISSTHNPKSYDDLWDGYRLGDLKPGTNYLWDMYSDYNFSANNPPQGNYKKEGDAVNREHSVPQSWFKERSPMKSDYYHVVPSDGYVNNRRSNYPFAEVDDSRITYQSKNGSKVGTSTSAGISGTVFEPIDEYKGDFARIYFYMCTRYYTQVGSWSGGVFQGSYPYLKSNYFQLYLKWAAEDPVSDKERQRNKGGYEFQGNRNPYVDYPHLLAQAFGGGYIPGEEVEETPQEKAQKIINLINAIGDVTLNSKSKIEAARNAYDTASDEIKALITNYDVLLQAENVYKELVESSSSEIGNTISCVFTDKNFANSSNYSFNSSIAGYGYENDRGVQFNKETDLTITTSSYPHGIRKISIVTSSNDKTYTFDVSINGVSLESNDKIVSSGNRNKALEFNASAPLAGEIKIHITTTGSGSRSLWIKSITIN